MKLLTKIIGVTAIALTVSAAYASPKFLVTNNLTNVDSNAFIDDTIASAHPTPANSTGKVLWTEVRIACLGQKDKCRALIKMDWKKHPVDIGHATMDIETGQITFRYINEKTCPYVFTINRPGETTISMR